MYLGYYESRIALDSFTKTMPLASLPLTKSKCSTFDHTRHEPARGAPVAIETHRLYQLEIDDPTGGWISCTRAQRTKYRQGPRWLHA